MKTTVLVTDKATWGKGPWVDEPDHAVWVDPATKLDCLIHRNDLGGLCGYVGIPDGHPWFGVGYDDEVFAEVAVHGGLTYGEVCQGQICHEVQAGRPAKVYWIGFDCGHAWDFLPKMAKQLQAIGVRALTGYGRAGSKSQYRRFKYVKAQVESLAQQVAAAGMEHPA